jgi:hypothetical protein
VGAKVKERGGKVQGGKLRPPGGGKVMRSPSSGISNSVVDSDFELDEPEVFKGRKRVRRGASGRSAKRISSESESNSDSDFVTESSPANSDSDYEPVAKRSKSRSTLTQVSGKRRTARSGSRKWRRRSVEDDFKSVQSDDALLDDMDVTPTETNYLDTFFGRQVRFSLHSFQKLTQ